MDHIILTGLHYRILTNLVNCLEANYCARFLAQNFYVG